MKPWMIVLIVIVGAILLGSMAYGGIYNQLVASEEGVKSAWAQVENVYQRRLDLIPNLVETVKGYAAHESQTLEAVIAARSRITQVNLGGTAANDPKALAQFDDAQRGLSSALSRLLVVAEQYPNLKADQNFLALQSQLEGTENRITVERRRFNEAAQTFNTKIRIFPNSLIAGWSGFQAKAYFQADQGAGVAPKVKF